MHETKLKVQRKVSKKNISAIWLAAFISASQTFVEEAWLECE